MIEPLAGPLVVVFGAGATVAEAASRQVAPTRRPPSDTDFFQRARNVGLTADLETVARHVREHFATDILGHRPPRMEQVFSWVFSQLRTAPEAERPARSLLGLYRDVIAKTCFETALGDWRSAAGVAGPECDNCCLLWHVLCD